VDVEVARWLVSAEAEPWLALAGDQADPSSLAAAAVLRRGLDADKAAVVLDQAVLQRRAAVKVGAGRLRFLTTLGLEQATRWDVAAWRAARMTEAGATRVVDLGCGLGLDALAMQEAGMQVVAVERDPVVAVLARANLRVEVMVGDAEAVAPDLLTPGTAVYCDPARRTARGRSWDVADLSPSWDFVTGLLDGSRTACIKLGPGVPHRVLPNSAEVTWVSHSGDAVEATIWAGPGASQGRRSAVLLPSGADLAADGSAVPIGEVGHWLVEPDPAVIRAGALGALAARHNLRGLVDGIAYLTSDSRPDVGPYGDVFEVVDQLPYDLRALRAWVRDAGIGTLEIKKRGVDIDPAVLRKQLKPSGKGSATLVVTPTGTGVRVLVVRRSPGRHTKAMV